MKKYFLLFLVLCITLLGACSQKTVQNEKSNEKVAEQKKLQVYTTVYPLRYFTERIGGNFVEVSSVYPPGANEHTFEPTQQDMIKLADADLFFYIGLGLEGFVEKAKSALQTSKVEFVPVTANIPDEKFDISTGHIHVEDEDDDHSHDGEDGHMEGEDHPAEDEHAAQKEHNDSGHHETDPHVWLSTSISPDLALAIKDALIEKLPSQATIFEANYQTLVEELQALDSQFKEMVAHASSNTFFVSHAAFGYIAGEYGLKQVPIAGLNSQDEPSQKKLVKLVALANELNIKYILFEQNVSSKLATTIQSEVGAEALVLHNLSVLTDEDIANNETYFTLMERNIETLRKALGNK
ncbi:zinc ABC transporter substrate-binding protein [Schinkia azotoformans]|uniref:metal ABC transporter solute-binding protein, Zn/Mn family n=1 Tax=Schinkia azotoformans TaxID=1454 RepID=UPI002E211495|nr:zinc ABC transporter substrate-binding protein [Schinkia azotoformans]MED4351932.1 zinc ABC transporter substrate-binding protein [Schinkia azotoformans]